MIDMPGSESAVFKLGHVCGQPFKMIIDTNHYKGNYPESCLIEYAVSEGADWKTLVGRLALGAHREHIVEGDMIKRIGEKDKISLIRVTMYPDGGISRVRMFASKE